MDLVQLTEAAHQLRGGSNAGLIVQDGRAVPVDTGLDRDTARKILRHVDSLKIQLAAVVITHVHADHSGSAATIRAHTGAPVYASGLEVAIIANPVLEPLYLFSGALPPARLRKFTLTEACLVDHILEPGDAVLDGVSIRAHPAAGHAPNQMMIAGGNVCFVADACFAPDILHKHGIPFLCGRGSDPRHAGYPGRAGRPLHGVRHRARPSRAPDRALGRGERSTADCNPPGCR